MKTSTINVHDMLSVLSVLGVEKRIGEVPGVESVTVNFAAGNATVRYDETRLEVADIKSAVRQSAYESAAPAAPASVHDHAGQKIPAANDVLPTVSSPAAEETSAGVSVATDATKPAAAGPPTTPKSSPAVPVATPALSADEPKSDPAASKGTGHEGHESHEGHEGHDDHKGGTTPGAPSAMSADMAHEMGHDGMDLAAMVRDMRNRFWICLIFTIPIFFLCADGWHVRTTRTTIRD